MARELRHARRKQPARQGAPGWVSFLAGLALGLFATFLVYVYDRMPGGVSALGAGSPSARAPTKSEGGAAQHKPERPRFEFYTILPEMEVTVPEAEIRPTDTRGAPRPAPSSGVGYVLQAGSFRRAEEADRLKARLALIGLEAEVQAVTVNGDDTWHRVRLGPFVDLRALDEARSRLREHQLEALVLKIKS